MKKFPHLYYCEECGAKVTVKARGIGVEPLVIRSCQHGCAQVIAPRRAILTGDGTLGKLPVHRRIAWHLRSWLSNLTGRCI